MSHWRTDSPPPSEDLNDDGPSLAQPDSGAHPPCRIAIEGVHGVGKSTLIADLVRSFPASAAAPEIVLDSFGALERQFGQGAFVVNDIARNALCDESATWWFLDRCPISTYTYQRAEHGEEAAARFLTLVENLQRNGVLMPPDLVVGLRADIASLEWRLKRAGREVPGSYLLRQVGGYERLADDERAQALLGPVVWLDTDSYSGADELHAAARTLIEEHCGAAGSRHLGINTP